MFSIERYEMPEPIQLDRYEMPEPIQLDRYEMPEPMSVQGGTSSGIKTLGYLSFVNPPSKRHVPFSGKQFSGIKTFSLSHNSASKLSCEGVGVTD